MPNKDNPPPVREMLCWKIYLKELFITDQITEKELEKLYPVNFDMNKIENDRELDIAVMIIDMVSKDIANTDDEISFKKIIDKDVTFILDGKIHNNFEKDWIFYLFECLFNKLISKEKYNFYKKSINFKKPELTTEEKFIIEEILVILRTKLVTYYPEAINYMQDPSFEVLMAANKLDV